MNTIQQNYLTALALLDSAADQLVDDSENETLWAQMDDAQELVNAREAALLVWGKAQAVKMARKAADKAALVKMFDAVISGEEFRKKSQIIDLCLKVRF